MNKKIFSNNLPKWKSGNNAKEGSVNWKESIGYKVKFIYEDIEGEVEIVGYDGKTQYLYIRYKNQEPFKIKTNNFLNCMFGKLLNKHTNEFKIEIGTRFVDEKRDITIINRKHMKTKSGWDKKFYKYKCNKCGFKCGEHYRNGEYKEELWIGESNLLHNQGCACCASQITVSGINSIKDRDPWMIKYFQNLEEAKKYSRGSTHKIYPICPDCNQIKTQKIAIGKIYEQHSIGCKICGDGISYPEKIMCNLLNQLKIKFSFQKIFNWSKNTSNNNFKLCGNKIYDFYIEDIGIIETHGLQHYEEEFSRINKKIRTLKEEQENDKAKKELALSNGIREENYIVIDCRKSELDWIRDNENGILNSRLSELFDLNNINWKQVEEFALSNLCKKACELKKNNPDMTTTQIGEILELDRGTIVRYLKKGSKVWDWINYDPKEEKSRVSSNVGKNRGNEIEIFKNGQSLGRFKNASVLAKESENKFGIKLIQSCITRVCNKKLKSHKGYYFEFV